MPEILEHRASHIVGKSPQKHQEGKHHQRHSVPVGCFVWCSHSFTITIGKYNDFPDYQKKKLQHFFRVIRLTSLYKNAITILIAAKNCKKMQLNA
jgi:hypothetical protein